MIKQVLVFWEHGLGGHRPSWQNKKGFQEHVILELNYEGPVGVSRQRMERRTSQAEKPW